VILTAQVAELAVNEQGEGYINMVSSCDEPVLAHPLRAKLAHSVTSDLTRLLSSLLP
jgi:hypothetical protein